MKTLFKLMVALCSVTIPLQANALCDVGQARVIHAQTLPFNVAVPTDVQYWVAPASNAPSFYYSYRTNNQIYINLLNAALASGKQVRVTGNAAGCPAAGLYRDAGNVVAVFVDWFN